MRMSSFPSMELRSLNGYRLFCINSQFILSLWSPSDQLIKPTEYHNQMYPKTIRPFLDGPSSAKAPCSSRVWYTLLDEKHLVTLEWDRLFTIPTLFTIKPHVGYTCMFIKRPVRLLASLSLSGERHVSIPSLQETLAFFRPQSSERDRAEQGHLCAEQAVPRRRSDVYPRPTARQRYHVDRMQRHG